MESSPATWLLFSPMYWNKSPNKRDDYIPKKTADVKKSPINKIWSIWYFELCTDVYVVATVIPCSSVYGHLQMWSNWIISQGFAIQAAASFGTLGDCRIHPEIMPSLLSEKLGLEGGSRPRYTMMFSKKKKKNHELNSPKQQMQQRSDCQARKHHYNNRIQGSWNMYPCKIKQLTIKLASRDSLPWEIFSIIRFKYPSFFSQEQ